MHPLYTVSCGGWARNRTERGCDAELRCSVCNATSFLQIDCWPEVSPGEKYTALIVALTYVHCSLDRLCAALILEEISSRASSVVRSAAIHSHTVTRPYVATLVPRLCFGIPKKFILWICSRQFDLVVQRMNPKSNFRI